jgi:hypothetical protein
MNDTVNDLVAAIQAKDAIATEAAFQAAMAEKISARLDDMRQTISQNMFKTPEQEVDQDLSIEDSSTEIETEEQ